MRLGLYGSQKSFGASAGPADVPAGIDKVIYAAQQAPSSFGTQPHNTNQELKKQLRAAAWGQAQLEESTHVLVFCSMTTEAVAARGEEFIAKTGIPQGYADMIRGTHTAPGAAAWSAKQAYIALGFALAAAAELKINSCPMEGFDSAAFAKILELPETLVPACILALGKEAADDAAARGHPRVRMPDLLIEKK